MIARRKMPTGPEPTSGARFAESNHPLDAPSFGHQTVCGTRGWKNADPDIPILKQAKAEYAKLQ